MAIGAPAFDHIVLHVRDVERAGASGRPIAAIRTAT